jgi:hypothetical protein
LKDKCSVLVVFNVVAVPLAEIRAAIIVVVIVGAAVVVAIIIVTSTQCIAIVAVGDAIIGCINVGAATFYLLLPVLVPIVLVF